MEIAKRSNNWKWFFLVLVIVSFIAAGTMIAYNLSQQLRPEQFEAARKLWEEKGPASYTLIYSSTFRSKSDAQDQTNHYVVKVANRKVTDALVNGIELKEGLEYHDMKGLFNEIERFMDLDEKEKRRVYRVATFDPATGAVRSYTRRVMGSTERQHITVEPIQVR